MHAISTFCKLVAYPYFSLHLFILFTLFIMCQISSVGLLYMFIQQDSPERYQKLVAFGTIDIYFTEMHSQVLTLLAG